MSTVVLRIKKKYFDAIESGEKTIEYRDVKPFYTKMFDGKTVDRVMLHYQSGKWLTRDVVKVEIIPTPDELKDSGIPFSDRVYAIHLKSV